ncbi:hypothetical protein [Mesorhizobium sp. M1E.F.Ca.ET.063.01.1.1]|uniref:hypothetical protein n=1 Tax=Mesorhizobium sp. M1E.F.Ca.ET.063.01.1.1 TaxID=2496750 RepID=UPI000FC9E7C0|nr:hypothetical protein [Mesorhizobium sp. M1E.F.Ca.ET.063.01.1.1]RUW83705.1 hypothetical protein EOA29_12235 [Mesorhizobium sp. M1E.F.Ca.ET.063.01.1.1]
MNFIFLLVQFFATTPDRMVLDIFLGMNFFAHGVDQGWEPFRIAVDIARAINERDAMKRRAALRVVK